MSIRRRAVSSTLSWALSVLRGRARALEAVAAAGIQIFYLRLPLLLLVSGKGRDQRDLVGQRELEAAAAQVAPEM
jgi:hypothetical protein